MLLLKIWKKVKVSLKNHYESFTKVVTEFQKVCTIK